MTVSKGEIWLVNSNPIKKNNEIGKIKFIEKLGVLSTQELLKIKELFEEITF